MSEPLPVTVFFDYHCPYSDRVVRWLDLLTPERVAPDYRFFPLEQVNRDPTAETWRVWEQPLDYLHYRGRQDRRPLAPFLVSALVEAIAPGGPVATFRRLVLDARFDERRDITDLELLAALARAAGVDAERLDAALRDPHAVAAARERIEARWRELKVDYALRYLDPMIQGIKEGAERTRKIVRDLRVFARSGDEAWQSVDLHEELESSLTLLNHLLKDRITVHRKYGALPSVECVRSQMDQVFLNVLANAAQAITGPGEIIIETRAEDGWAVVVIGDTGPGIPAEVIGRIFDPFFTTKPVGEGTGLGLSISYEIVKRHGGTIEAASPPGQGAVFTIRLPLHRRAA